MRILGICGSLRDGAYSLFVLQALKAVASPATDLNIRRLHDVPMFGPDDHAKRNFPPGAESLREQVIAADAILIATPEYNHSVPGALKNALEWLHGRPGLLEDKPAGMVSTAPGPHGGINAQHALQLILTSMGAKALSLPEIAVNDVRNKFDAGGALTDEPARESLEAFMKAFEASIS
ncbi:MAG: NADPH-dependent FMN reductase [Candidatus Lustribacter sp.]|jgi:chromate reductase